MDRRCSACSVSPLSARVSRTSRPPEDGGRTSPRPLARPDASHKPVGLPALADTNVLRPCLRAHDVWMSPSDRLRRVIVGPPRPASTVVLLKPSDRRFDVCLVRRHDEVAFMGGAYVFPGGRVDPA